MASPTVEGRTSAFHNTTNSLSLPLPTPVAAGDLIIAAVDTDLPNPITFPSPWVKIGDVSQAPGGGDVEAHVAVAYLDASGGETSVAIGTTFNTHAAAIAIRITGHEPPGTQAPEITIVARSIVSVADIPALTPTGGAKDYLWIAGAGRGVNHTATGAPTNYSNLTTITATGSQGASCHTCERSANLSSDDPGNITGTWNTDTTVAFLVAIHPLSAVPQKFVGAGGAARMRTAGFI